MLLEATQTVVSLQSVTRELRLVPTFAMQTRGKSKNDQFAATLRACVGQVRSIHTAARCCRVTHARDASSEPLPLVTGGGLLAGTR